AAALGVKGKVIKIATNDKRSQLFGQSESTIAADNNQLFLKDNQVKAETYSLIITRHGVSSVEEEVSINVSTRENAQQQGNEEKKSEENAAVKEDEAVDRKRYTFQSFGAQFAKVLVDPTLGTVRVSRIVSVMDI